MHDRGGPYRAWKEIVPTNIMIIGTHTGNSMLDSEINSTVVFVPTNIMIIIQQGSKGRFPEFGT
jgi:hypothetical protein